MSHCQPLRPEFPIAGGRLLRRPLHFFPVFGGMRADEWPVGVAFGYALLGQVDHGYRLTGGSSILGCNHRNGFMKVKLGSIAGGTVLASLLQLGACQHTPPVATPTPAVPAASVTPAPIAAPAPPVATAPVASVAAPVAASPVTSAPAVAGDGAANAGAKRVGAPPTAAGLKQRWEALGNLLERSSSAKHIEHEGSAESKQLQKDARATRARAKEAIDAGALEKADTLLREASQLMFKAERASRSPTVAADKAKTDYVARRGSVQALMQTGKRIAGEEHASRPEFATAEGLLKEAEKLAAEGKHAEGRVQLDQAYALITGAVRGMREGKEIKAEKKFANKGEEYQYEQARNDDYKNLIANLNVERDASWNDAASSASKLRDEADVLAGKGNHEAALSKIFESTNKLKSLLRRAGFPII